MGEGELVQGADGGLQVEGLKVEVGEGGRQEGKVGRDVESIVAEDDQFVLLVKQVHVDCL